MNRSSDAPHRRSRRLPRALLPAASLLLATTGVQAQAQSANCDKLRQTLSARIEAGGIQGYGLDILPAKETPPAGGKVIGTCDGGAFKAVYRRFGGSSSPPAVTSEAPAPVRMAAGPSPAPPAPAPSPAPTPPSPPPPAPQPVPQPAPQPTPAPPPPPAPAPPPVVSPVIITAAEPITMVAASSPPATLTLASASRDPMALPAVDVAPPAESPSWLQRASARVRGDWLWTFWALLLLPLVGWLWSWLQHRRLYDAAGLPRGPRL